MTTILFQFFALKPNHIIRQRGHPETFFNGTFQWLERILGARIDETEQTFHNGGGGTIALEVDQGFIFSSAGDLRRFLGVVG